MNKNKRAKDKKIEGRKFLDNRKLIWVAVATVSIIILTGTAFYFFPHQPDPPKAAIIDQLSSSQLTDDFRYPNQTFIEAAKELLYQRFSEVDYYSDNATVDRYRLLSALNYKLILWRTHSALNLESKYIAICSSEKYGSQNYEQYLKNGQLTLCNITDDPNLYYAINPKFIQEVMTGKFEDTVIILMSCNGLRQGFYTTADTFLGKGAKAFISWNGWISTYDNDDGITLLLQYLIEENQTIEESVKKIPVYVSSFWPECQLRCHPLDISNYTIPDYRQTQISGSAMFVLTASSMSNFGPRSVPFCFLSVSSVSKRFHIIGCAECQRPD
ncbi:MAG: hypothetical protein OEY22_08420 [Candidatus Bathyarchaeota archaeon]|nr:hypothetical protein [Candidatus Bathyarchaeota archaeon]MDH5787900.1 hypothetical protein [Candidatus Bathyarchaeota archaeon]